MRSNMAMELIVYTPTRVLDYITKGNKDKMGEDKDQSQSYVEKMLEGLDGKDVAVGVGDRAKDMIEVCQSEAFFRIDKQLHMSDSNVPVVWVNSSFPDARGSTYAHTDHDGVELSNRQGEYRRKSRIEDKYQKK
jgi:hypothetical protein